MPLYVVPRSLSLQTHVALFCSTNGAFLHLLCCSCLLTLFCSCHRHRCFALLFVPRFPFCATLCYARVALRFVSFRCVCVFARVAAAVRFVSIRFDSRQGEARQGKARYNYFARKRVFASRVDYWDSLQKVFGIDLVHVIRPAEAVQFAECILCSM